ncbi:hypothetical protein IIO_04934 [Bacillus cereus VD115]|nr:hypothetical protein IIO_04934 [Bacillus cereus VD115]
MIDGRQTHSIGATLKECQDILYGKGAINAMAMDRGSSATLYLGGRIINIYVTHIDSKSVAGSVWIQGSGWKQVGLDLDEILESQC